MVGEYVETEMSKRARKFFLEICKLTSVERDNYDAGRYDYDSRLRVKLSDSSGNLDFNKVYEALGIEEQKFSLVKLSFQINLDDEEVRKTIEKRFSKCYNTTLLGITPDDGREFTRKSYPLWCQDFEIQPNPNFPDW